MTDEAIPFDQARERPGAWLACSVDAGRAVLLRMEPHGRGVDCSVSVGGGNWQTSVDPVRSDGADRWFSHHAGIDPRTLSWSPLEDRRESYVYVVQALGADRWKIGRTGALAARLSTLQTGSPVPLVLVWSQVETEAINEVTLHERFAALRKHGEWFDLSSVLVGKTVEQLMTEAGQ